MHRRSSLTMDWNANTRQWQQSRPSLPPTGLSALDSGRTETISKVNSSLKRLSSAAFARKLSLKAGGIMRLLRQISLDGSNILRPPSPLSTSTFKFASDGSGANFGRALSDTIGLATALLCELSGDANKANRAQTKDKKSKDAPATTILRVLEELNSLIVHLIRLSADKEAAARNGDKSKSKIRRQYSALVEGGPLFRRRRSFGRRESEGSLNNNPSASPSTSPPKGRCSTSPLPIDESPLGIIEESVRKLVDSQILPLLIAAMPNIGFEEKKLVRILITNSMILEANKTHFVVDYLCEPSNNILRSLVRSYELGQSDVTLNCGCIIRFASQYESIVGALLESDYFYNFFDYMKRSPVDYPFDVAMDVFYTFKTILVRHKAATMTVIGPNPAPFFDAFIDLLHHAEKTENYVTKRQALEIFANIFSGDECCSLRDKFITEDKFICPVILYLWNRNLQIRLRCVVLLNQLFRVSHSKDGDGGSGCSKEASLTDLMENEGENFTASVCQAEVSDGDMQDAIRARSSSVEHESTKEEWKVALLLDKMHIALRQRHNASTQSEVEIYRDIRDTLLSLRSNCSNSSIKLFTSQSIFVDQVLRALNVS